MHKYQTQSWRQFRNLQGAKIGEWVGRKRMVRGNEEKRRWMFTSVLRGAILLSRRGCNGDAWKSG